MVYDTQSSSGSSPPQRLHLGGPPVLTPQHHPSSSQGGRNSRQGFDLVGRAGSNNKEQASSPSTGSRESPESPEGFSNSNFKSMAKMKGGMRVSMASGMKNNDEAEEDNDQSFEDAVIMRMNSGGQSTSDARLAWLETRTRIAMGMSVVDAIKRSVTPLTTLLGRLDPRLSRA